MCLIIDAPAKATIPDYIISTAIPRNNDGWGAIWHRDGVTHAKRSLDMSQLPKFLRSIQNYNRLIHLRLKTHGVVNIDNCHPFRVADGLYFMHNGIMAEFDSVQPNLSDTAEFVRAILKPAVEGRNPMTILDEFWFRNMLDKYAGTSQRFAIMDARGHIHRSGSWTKHSSGVLLSNTYAWGEVIYSKGNYGSTSFHKRTRQHTAPTEWRNAKDFDGFWAEQVDKYRQKYNIVDAEGDAVNVTFSQDNLDELTEHDLMDVMDANPEIVAAIIDQQNARNATGTIS